MFSLSDLLTDESSQIGYRDPMRNLLIDIHGFKGAPDNFVLEWDTEVYRISESLCYVVTRKDGPIVRYNAWLVDVTEGRFLASQTAYVFSSGQTSLLASQDLSLLMAASHVVSALTINNPEKRWFALTPLRGNSMSVKTAEECIMVIFGVLFVREGDGVLFVPESSLDLEACHDQLERSPTEDEYEQFWRDVGLAPEKWGAYGRIGQID